MATKFGMTQHPPRSWSWDVVWVDLIHVGKPGIRGWSVRLTMRDDLGRLVVTYLDLELTSKRKAIEKGRASKYPRTRGSP